MYLGEVSLKNRDGTELHKDVKNGQLYRLPAVTTEEHVDDNDDDTAHSSRWALQHRVSSGLVKWGIAVISIFVGLMSLPSELMRNRELVDPVIAVSVSVTMNPSSRLISP